MRERWKNSLHLWNEFHSLSSINSRSEVRGIALHLCVYHNLRGNFTVRLQEVTGTRPRKQATTHLASVHSHRRERKREIYVYIYIDRGNDHQPPFYVYIYICVCVYVYGSVARGRQDNYRFEIVYAGTLIEPRRLNNSHRRDSSSSFFSIVETARRGEGQRERERERKKLLFPFTPPSLSPCKDDCARNHVYAWWVIHGIQR